MMSPEELQKFRAHRLKELRKNELGMTQKDLANAVGVNLLSKLTDKANHGGNENLSIH